MYKKMTHFLRFWVKETRHRERFRAKRFTSIAAFVGRGVNFGNFSLFYASARSRSCERDLSPSICGLLSFRALRLSPAL